MLQNCGRADKKRCPIVHKLSRALPALSCRSDAAVCLTRESSAFQTVRVAPRLLACPGSGGHMPILRGTNSALLPCGCLIGLYETYRGQTVALVDVKGPSCTEHLHRVNACVQWNA